MNMVASMNAVKRSVFRRCAKIASAALTTAAVMFSVLGLVLMYWQFAKYDPPYTFINPQAHFATQLDRQTFVVGREFKILWDVEFHITRELLQKKDGILTRIELPATSVAYQKGDYKTQRIMEMPRLDPGEYELFNRVCWAANVFRRDCLDLPTLTLEVFGELK